MFNANISSISAISWNSKEENKIITKRSTKGQVQREITSSNWWLS